MVKKVIKKSRKEITIDDLAVMVQNSLLSLEDNLGRKIDNTEAKLRKEIKSAKDELKAELNKKVDIFTHKDLEYRVEKLEEKSRLMVRDK